jgi:hypothetical protein
MDITMNKFGKALSSNDLQYGEKREIIEKYISE